MSLARNAVRGVIWTITTSVGGRAIGLLGTLALTHFLVPEQYGEFHIALLVVALTSALMSFGFGQYLVANPQAGRAVAFHATVFHCTLGFIALALMVVFRDHFGAFFKGEPNLGPYLPLLAVASALERLAYIPSRILARDMRFNVLAIRALASELVYTAVTLYLAWRGWGARSLLWGVVARAVVSSAILIVSVDRRDWLEPSPLRRDTARQLMTFFPLGIANLVHWLNHKGDNLVIGALYGKAAVGGYNLAYNLADVPASHIGEHIGDVLLPSFAKLENDEARRRALVRATGLLALAVFPLAVGLGAVAHTLIRAAFDESWSFVAPMLVALSTLSVLRPVGWLIRSYLEAKLQSSLLLKLEVFRALALYGMIVAAAPFGVVGSCVGVGLAFGLHVLASAHVVKRNDGILVRDLLVPTLPPLMACVPMAIAVLGVRYLLAPSLGPWPLLGVEIVAGAVTFVASAFAFAGPQARDFVQLVRNALSRRRAEA